MPSLAEIWRALHGAWRLLLLDTRGLADLLIPAGADVKTANRDGATALSLAAENGSAAMIEKLIEAGADPNERRPNGETPLMMAARNGNLAALKVLLDHRADIRAQERFHQAGKKCKKPNDHQHLGIRPIAQLVTM